MSLVAIVAVAVAALIGLAMLAVLDSIVGERRAARDARRQVSFVPRAQRTVRVPRSLAPPGQ